MLRKMERVECALKKQGLAQGSCSVRDGELKAPACQTTLREDSDGLRRLINTIHLSRPENYLSIYQSGCNMSCRKCHSWSFSKVKEGEWYRPEDILQAAKEYEKNVTLFEPREQATSWHAQNSCRCCSSCVTQGRSSDACPGLLEPGQIVLSPQGFGPARNIVAFTGGDLTCRPEFYAQCASLIKANTRLWMLIETNGYGLTAQNLEVFKNYGVDGFWLDIKAWDDGVHRWLTGCTNQHILELPSQILKSGFVLEVLSLYIPEVVDCDQLQKIAAHLAAVDTSIPFTILAFFPEHRMGSYRSPTTSEMIRAYESAKSAGLDHVRLGNLGVFVKTDEDYQLLLNRVNLKDR